MGAVPLRMKTRNATINFGAPPVWASAFQTMAWLVYVAGLIEILGGRKVD